MKVTIITINLNNLRGLRRTMDSVVSQTSKDYEWIVIDGGSTDGSAELICENEGQVAWWVSEPDRGVYNAMNKGIEKANGDYLIFMNSGDIFSSADIIASFTASNPKADVIYGNAIDVDENGKEVKKHVSPEKLTLSYFWNHWLHHQATFFHRHCFEHFRYNEELKVVSDLQLCVELFYNGYTFQKWDHLVAIAQSGGLSYVYPHVADERKAVFQNIIPTAVRAEIDEIVWLRQVDLWDTVRRIVGSKRWVRNAARLALLPFRLLLL